MNEATAPVPEDATVNQSTGAHHSSQGDNVLKALSPGVVDFLFRRLVGGEAAEDLQWHREGTALSEQLPGAELARRLAEADIDALTPTELLEYVRAAQRLSGWAETLRAGAVKRYCTVPPSRPGSTRARRLEGGI